MEGHIPDLPTLDGALDQRNRSFNVSLLEAHTSDALRGEDQAQSVVGSLRDLGSGQLDSAKARNAKLQELEGKGDQLIIEVLEDLWSGRHETTKVIVLKDLYELLEKMIDRCRDAGKAVTQIVLKNS